MLSTLLRARRPFANSAIAIGSDQVIAGVWLPAGSILGDIRGHVSLVSPTEITLSQVVVCSVEGWILPVDDPDSVATMNALWDSHVPKDTTTFTLDLDEAAADAAPFYEMGSIAWEFLYNVGAAAKRIYHRHDVLSAVDSVVLTRQDTETPFTEQFFAGKRYAVKVRGGGRITQPSLAVFAVGSPATTTTSATVAVSALVEHEWGRIKFIDHVLEQALMSSLGLTEVGAETPWDEASDLMKKYLDADMLEANAGTVIPTVWLASGELVFDVIVPGRMRQKVLTGGR